MVGDCVSGDPIQLLIPSWDSVSEAPLRELIMEAYSGKLVLRQTPHWYHAMVPTQVLQWYVGDTRFRAHGSRTVTVLIGKRVLYLYMLWNLARTPY